MICQTAYRLARQMYYLYPTLKLAVATLLSLVLEVAVIVQIHMTCLGKL